MTTLLVLLALAAPPPRPDTRPVARAELVGLWKMGPWTVSLAENGSYASWADLPFGPRLHAGHWRVKGGALELLDGQVDREDGWFDPSVLYSGELRRQGRRPFVKFAWYEGPFTPARD
jgi:hypothetical protein